MKTIKKTIGILGITVIIIALFALPYVLDREHEFNTLEAIGCSVITVFGIALSSCIIYVFVDLIKNND